MVSLGDFVEHEARGSEVAAFAVQVDKGVSHGNGGRVAKLEDVPVELFPEAEVVHGGCSLENGGEGEIVGGCGGCEHGRIGGDGVVEGRGLGLVSEEVYPLGRRTEFYGVGGGGDGGWRRVFGSRESADLVMGLEGKRIGEWRLDKVKIRMHFKIVSFMKLFLLLIFFYAIGKYFKSFRQKKIKIPFFQNCFISIF